MWFFASFDRIFSQDSWHILFKREIISSFVNWPKPMQHYKKTNFSPRTSSFIDPCLFSANVGLSDSTDESSFLLTLSNCPGWLLYLTECNSKIFLLHLTACNSKIFHLFWLHAILEYLSFIWLIKILKYFSYIWLHAIPKYFSYIWLHAILKYSSYILLNAIQKYFT